MPTSARKKRARRAAKRPPARKPTMAERADKHVLYERSVQDVVSEIDYVIETFRKIRGRDAIVLREDFCGTGNTSCEWVRRGPEKRAYGVDLDPSVLAWGAKHKLTKLNPDQRGRIELIEGNVLAARTPPADVLLAMNFSYWLFKTRAELLAYFKSAYRNLAPGGVLFLDGYGGWDAHRPMREPRDCGRFTYVWHQAEIDPVTNHMTCHIHFKFPDGSKMEKAFTYHWRLWSIPEIRELLAEVGFVKSTVYWEGWDEKAGEGNGEFEPVEHAESDPGWLAYIVAER